MVLRKAVWAGRSARKTSRCLVLGARSQGSRSAGESPSPRRGGHRRAEAKAARFKIRWKMDLHSGRVWCRHEVRGHFGRCDQQFGWQRPSQFRGFDARFVHRIWQGHRCGRSPLRRHGYRDLHPRRRLQGPVDRDQEVGSNGFSLVCSRAPVHKSAEHLCLLPGGQGTGSSSIL